MNTEFELLENAAVRLKVTVPKEEVNGAYDSLVKDYCSKVAINGFRKGKVPPSVLIRKFGDSLLSETAKELIERGLKEAFEKVEQKPLAYSIPELAEEVQLELDNPYTFEVTYDTFPQVEIGEYREVEVEQPVVEILREDINRELEAIREQNALVVDKREGTVAEGDTVTIDYVELDEKGEEVENTKREGFTFGVGSGYNLYRIDDEIQGMAKDEERNIDKEYPEDYEFKELAGKKIRLRVKVTSIKEKQLPELNDELAQDVSEDYKTLDDLKGDLKKRLNETLDARIRERNVSAILDKIVGTSTVPLPKSMTEQELKLRWSGFIRRLRANESQVLRSLESEGRSREDLFEEWRPGVEQALKTQLVLHKLGEVENIEVNDEELDEEIKGQAGRQKRDFKEVKEELSRAMLLESIRDNLTIRKIHDMLLEGAKIKRGKKTKFLDLMGGNS